MIEKGQTGIAIEPQSSLEGTQLSVSVTDADLAAALERREVACCADHRSGFQGRFLRAADINGRAGEDS